MKKKFIAIAIVFLFISLMITLSKNPNQSMAETLDNNIINMMEQVENSSNSNSTSSNPYDYKKNNTYYDEIVGLGCEAIPYLEDYIINSPVEGLREYLLAIAIEEITEIDLKELNKEKPWDTSKAFVKEWDKTLSIVDSEVNKVLRSNKSNTEKNEIINKYGLLSIAYSVDYLKNEKNKSSHNIKSLKKNITMSELENNFNIKFDENNLKLFQKWSKINDSEFESFKRYIKKN